MLRIVVPLVRRERSEDTELDAPAPEILWVDGEAGGIRCDKELKGKNTRIVTKCSINSIHQETNCYALLRKAYILLMRGDVTLLISNPDNNPIDKNIRETWNWTLLIWASRQLASR